MGLFPALRRAASGAHGGAGAAPFLLAASLLLAFLLRAGTVLHHDIWHEMALARWVLASGRFPSHDLFSWASGGPYANYEWGAGMIALLAQRAGGAAGLTALNLILAIITAVLCARLLRGAGLALGVLGALPCIFVLASHAYPVVAQSYTNLLFAALLLLLVRDRAGARWWIALWLPLFVLWVNLHGGLVLGLAAVAITAVERTLRGEPWRHLALVFAAMLGLIVCNPDGAGFYAYLARTFTMPRTVIPEWAPFALTSSVSPQSICLLLTLLALSYALWRLGPRRIPGVLLVLLLAALSMRASKVMPLYLLAWMAVVPEALSATALGMRANAFLDRNRRAAVFAAAPVFVLLVAMACVRPWLVTAPGTKYPTGPAAYLRQVGFRGNAMTEFREGAYLIWSLGPSVKVGCDSRYDLVYPDQWVSDNVAFYKDGSPAAWNRILEPAGADIVIIRRDWPAALRLIASKPWPRVYRDDGFDVYARPGIHLPYADRSGQPLAGPALW